MSAISLAVESPLQDEVQELIDGHPDHPYSAFGEKRLRHAAELAP